VFNRIRQTEEKPSALDTAIDNLISEMQGYDAHSEEYQKMASNLRTLMEAKAMEPKPDKVSANTMAVIAGNLIGIVLILGFEKSNVLTSKSLNFVIRPKV
jgi:hypothetical protein